MKSKLFVVFHSKLHENQYLGKEDRYTFAKVGEQTMFIESDLIKGRVTDSRTMPVFVNKGKHWAESEFLISLYETVKANPSYLGDSEFVGFTQYDHTTSSKSGVDLISFLDSVTLDDSNYVSMSPIDMGEEIHRNHIAMDFSNPQKLQGDPLCYFPMIADYNRFYGTNRKYADFVSSPKIALCSSFVMSVKNFMKMMEFCVWSSTRNNLDQFDPQRKHRLAGGLMERYYGCWLILSGLNMIQFQVSGLERL